MNYKEALLILESYIPCSHDSVKELGYGQSFKCELCGFVASEYVMTLCQHESLEYEKALEYLCGLIDKKVEKEI